LAKTLTNHLQVESRRLRTRLAYYRQVSPVSVLTKLWSITATGALAKKLRRAGCYSVAAGVFPNRFRQDPARRFKQTPTEPISYL